MSETSNYNYDCCDNGNDWWIWIIIAIVVIWLLWGDNRIFGGGGCGCGC